MRLAGKTALVTGATSNIGRAIAVALAAEGAQVVVAGRNKERGDEVVAEIRSAGGSADFVAVDLDGTKAAANELAGEATRLLGGRIDILVNNAGAIDGGGTTRPTRRRFDQVYAVNVKSPYFLIAAIAPAMARPAAARSSTSAPGSRGSASRSEPRTRSKGALETLTRAWSAEFGPSGVRVNAIAPGVVHRATRGPPGPRDDDGTPYGQIGTPEAIASAAVFLASDDAEFIHGTVLDVDGGRLGVAVIAG